MNYFKISSLFLLQAFLFATFLKRSFFVFLVRFIIAGFVVYRPILPYSDVFHSNDQRKFIR